MSVRRVIVHSDTRAASSAWPRLIDEADVMAGVSADNPTTATTLIGDLLRDGPVRALFAHSALAIPAVQGVRESPHHVSSLVLVEPALYDLVRGHDAVESHISMVSEAFARARTGDLFGAWEIIRPLMFGGVASTEEWPAERPQAESFFARDLPWGHEIDGEVIATHPTLVLTGAWNDEYEAIADACAAFGAEHRVLDGYQHRVQDHPRFPEVVEDFLARI